MAARSALRIVSIAALTAAVWVNGAQAAPAGGPLRRERTLSVGHHRIARFFQDGNVPACRLQDGREFSLIPLSDGLRQKLQDDAARSSRSPEAGAGASPSSMLGTAALYSHVAGLGSSYVDNRAYHGIIRNQGGRNTCVSFSTTAAVEGRYRRLNPTAYADLHLSEQWANHLQKMVHLPDTLVAHPAWRESQMGCWGGSGCEYLMRVLKKYGLPLETQLAYNPSASYENTTELTDNPWVDWTVPTTPQRTVDDFNLDPMTLPITALGAAPFRPVGVVNLTYEQVRTPAFLEGLVRDGYDVVFDLALVSPQVTTADGAWKPGPGAMVQGGHSMLIVGYNQPRQYFIVRNSWGYDATDGGYTRVDYSYIQQFAYAGCYVTSVADPAAETSRARLYVGRWHMNHDGWQGRLDIYRLPGLFHSSELNGQPDYRIGTYFDHAGRAHRVNGYLWGGDLVFYINFSTPNAPYGALAGTKFVAQLFSWDDRTMAGLEYQDGVTYGFHASKDSTPGHMPAPASANPRDAFLGHWNMNHDGWKGDLYLSGRGASAISGWYRDGDGN